MDAYRELRDGLVRALGPERAAEPEVEAALRAAAAHLERVAKADPGPAEGLDARP
jgi:hypothetical protein